MFEGKNILITGGTGSFGNAFTRFLLESSGVAEIIIFSRDEKKQHDMRLALDGPRLNFIIGDVRDRSAVFNAMRGVDMVFHAAALKQVPSCEFHPMEAVRTNVLGTENVLDAAEFHKVEKVVVLSTDKAVYPINAMGISKAMMEKVMMAKARKTKSNTVFCGVRYGNVMYSRGSVIPLYVNQIINRTPLTVTNPEMTRFLLPLEKAVDLVVFALENGRGGEIFVRKSPAATVGDLATACLNIFKSSVGIKTIGVRAGEKMHETLLTSEELMYSKEFEEYFILPGEEDVDYDDFFTVGHGERFPEEGYNSFNTERLDVTGIEELLLSLPEIKAMLDG